MKPRHLFAMLLLAAEAPILAVLIAGWAITGVIYGTALVAGRARLQLRHAGRRGREALSIRRRRPPRIGGPAWA